MKKNGIVKVKIGQEIVECCWHDEDGVRSWSANNDFGELSGNWRGLPPEVAAKGKAAIAAFILRRVRGSDARYLGFSAQDIQERIAQLEGRVRVVVELDDLPPTALLNLFLLLDSSAKRNDLTVDASVRLAKAAKAVESFRTKVRV